MKTSLLGMVDCTVLHCTVLYCTVLYCVVLYCTVQVSSLRVRVEAGEVTTNNNRPRHLEEDTLYRVMAALEALSTQVPEEIR